MGGRALPLRHGRRRSHPTGLWPGNNGEWWFWWCGWGQWTVDAAAASRTTAGVVDVVCLLLLLLLLGPSSVPIVCEYQWGGGGGGPPTHPSSFSGACPSQPPSSGPPTGSFLCHTPGGSMMRGGGGDLRHPARPPVEDAPTWAPPYPYRHPSAPNSGGSCLPSVHGCGGGSEEPLQARVEGEGQQGMAVGGVAVGEAHQQTSLAPHHHHTLGHGGRMGKTIHGNGTFSWDWRTLREEEPVERGKKSNASETRG